MRRVAAGLVGLAVLVICGVSDAGFTTSPVKSHTISSATLQPPTGPAVTFGTCTVAVTDRLVVSWTATASTWADGYEIARSLVSGGPYLVVGTVTGPGTTSYTDSPLTFSTTFYYVVRATKSNWRSGDTAAVSNTTRSVLCL